MVYCGGFPIVGQMRLSASCRCAYKWAQPMQLCALSVVSSAVRMVMMSCTICRIVSRFIKGKKVQKFKSSKVQEVQKFKGSKLTYGLRLSRLTYCLPRTRLIASSLLPLGIAQTSLALLSLNHSLRDSSCKHDSPLAALSVRPLVSKLPMALAAPGVQGLNGDKKSPLGMPRGEKGERA